MPVSSLPSQYGIGSFGQAAYHFIDFLDATGQKCWQVLCRIPYGQTISYSEEASLAGNPKACRAVGMANHRNPLPIIIPCHRVIGKNGALTGYGSGIGIKQFLLQLETGKDR